VSTDNTFSLLGIIPAATQSLFVNIQIRTVSSDSVSYGTARSRGAVIGWVNAPIQTLSQNIQAVSRNDTGKTTRR